MPEAAHPTRLAIAQQFMMHFGHRDFDKGLELLSPLATVRVPGSHALAGVFSGQEEILKAHNRLVELTIGTFDMIKWEDWMVGEHHVAALANAHIQMKGRLYTGRHLYLVQFDPDDKIREIVVFFEDERSVERFFSS